MQPNDEESQTQESEIVYRDGKPYRKVNPKNATWLRK
jgi:hypothetical protein